MKGLWIAPYRRIIIISSQNPDEAIRLLRNNMNQRNSFFKGRIKGYTFEVIQRITGRASFLPLVKGRIREHPQGSEIIVVIRLHTLAFAVLAGWIAMLVNGLFGSDSAWIFRIIAVLATIFVFLLTWQGFDGFATEATRFLERLFSAKSRVDFD